MARAFNGTSDVLVSPANPTVLNISTNAPFSTCGWMNFQTLSPASQVTLFGKGFDGGSSTTAYTFTLSTVPEIQFTTFTGGVQHGVIIAVGGLAGLATNAWHHFYGEYTGAAGSPTNRWSMWFDGVIQSGFNSTDATGPTSNTAKFDAGAVDITGSPGQFANVTLADLAVFNGPLTGSEILALGTGTLRPNTSMSKTLLGYWKMDASSPATDQSGNSNDLTVTGTTVVADPPFTSPTTYVLMGQICA